jgi:hypothetical protein
VTELVHVYGPRLVAAGLGSATVIWQAKSGNTEVKNELKAAISRVEKKTDMMNDTILMVAREVTTAMETKKNYKGMHAFATKTTNLLYACRFVHNQFMSEAGNTPSLTANPCY